MQIITYTCEFRIYAVLLYRFDNYQVYTCNTFQTAQKLLSAQAYLNISLVPQMAFFCISNIRKTRLSVLRSELIKLG